MELVLGGVAVFAVVVGLLWWTRRHGNPGLRSSDPQGNRNIAASGGVPNTNPHGIDGSAGGAGFGP
ncbi:MAG: hypothetical protein U0R68_01625 [Candidatus Nanopelagicales bacterium]